MSFLVPGLPHSLAILELDHLFAGDGEEVPAVVVLKVSLKLLQRPHWHVWLRHVDQVVKVPAELEDVLHAVEQEVEQSVAGPERFESVSGQLDVREGLQSLQLTEHPVTGLVHVYEVEVLRSVDLSEQPPDLPHWPPRHRHQEDHGDLPHHLGKYYDKIVTRVFSHWRIHKFPPRIGLKIEYRGWDKSHLWLLSCHLSRYYGRVGYPHLSFKVPVDYPDASVGDVNSEVAPTGALVVRTGEVTLVCWDPGAAQYSRLDSHLLIMFRLDSAVDVDGTEKRKLEPRNYFVKFVWLSVAGCSWYFH